MTHAKSGRKSTDVVVKLLCTHDNSTPCNKVLQNTLVELIKNVQSDRSVDVGAWEVGPEGLVDAARDLVSHAVLTKLIGCSSTLPSSSEDAFGPWLSVWRMRVWVLEMKGGTSTLRASSILGASNETLFGIVCHIRCKDGEDTSHAAIPTGHKHTLLRSLLERL